MASDHHAPIATIPNSLCIPWNLSFGGAQPASAVATAYKSTVLKWSCGRTGAERWGSVGSNRELRDSNHVYVHLIGRSMQLLQPAIVMCVGNLSMIPMHGGGLVSSIIAIESILQHLNTGGVWYGVVGIVPQWCSQPCTICHKSWSDTANETRKLPACRVRARLMMNSRSLQKSKCHQIWQSAAFLAEA